MAGQALGVVPQDILGCKLSKWASSAQGQERRKGHSHSPSSPVNLGGTYRRGSPKGGAMHPVLVGLVTCTRCDRLATEPGQNLHKQQGKGGAALLHGLA